MKIKLNEVRLKVFTIILQNIKYALRFLAVEAVRQKVCEDLSRSRIQKQEVEHKEPEKIEIYKLNNLTN